ncbi:Endoribonuclease L-PSP [Tilletiaria anomala UBC 951]|uniref:Endoribonuclease L-PSP n=1 Tax=Tilletiaria anomala (strain ATCC 24038 / CBS 436.72 / UBC 951) TaxID=1037660 RepID=A0A066VCZ1_TILAU|nr:Endoribonuclease L-PSP [Tilletiaria anomala UBC 951]KDN36639.1 Endoribonuclease L-PSP [Tilletiaria anomala UBC 951]
MVLLTFPRGADAVIIASSGSSDIYSHYAKAGGLLYLSGQVPMDGTGHIVPGGIEEHTAQCISNIEQVLKSAGSSIEKLVKVNIFLKHMSDFDAVNEIYEKALPTPKPARTCMQAGKLPLDVLIEIEAVALA